MNSFWNLRADKTIHALIKHAVLQFSGVFFNEYLLLLYEHEDRLDRMTLMNRERTGSWLKDAR